MPFLDTNSKEIIFQKVLEGELNYNMIRVILPYADYLTPQIEAAVVYGALDIKALDIL